MFGGLWCFCKDMDSRRWRFCDNKAILGGLYHEETSSRGGCRFCYPEGNGRISLRVRGSQSEGKSRLGWG